MMDNRTPIGETRLPVQIKAGYAIGQATDSLSFNLFYFFFLIFLTDIVGIPPIIAGTVILIAVIWDAITDPIIGSISDNLTLRWGRRRPLMLGALIPFSLFLFLLFSNFSFITPSMSAPYFTIVAILFWSSYKIFVIPFFALGAEITDNFNERTSLRVWASYGIYFSVLLASATPPAIVAFSEGLGSSSSGGWINVGIIFALLTLITGLICWYSTRGREITLQHQDMSEIGNKEPLIRGFFSNIFSILKISSVYYLALSVFLWSCTSAMSGGALIYLMEKNLSYSPGKISFSFIIYSLLALIWLPCISFCTTKFDKRLAYYIALSTSATIVILFYFIGFSSFILLLIFFVFLQLGNSFFWTVYYSMMYDISELDEFISGKRREGSIASFMSFTQKVGAAFAIWVSGLVLGFNGYDGALLIQPESAHTAILALATWMPGITGLLAAMAAFAYPITRKRFTELMVVLKAKRAGENYSTDKIKELL